MKRYSNKIAPELCERSIDLSMCVNGRTRRSLLCSLLLFTRHNQFCWIHTTATAHCYVLADVDFTSFGLLVTVTEVASVRTKLLPRGKMIETCLFAIMLLILFFFFLCFSFCQHALNTVDNSVKKLNGYYLMCSFSS